MVRSLGQALDVPVDYIDVRMWSHKDSEEYRARLPIIWPDLLASALFRQSEQTFKRCFAPGDPDDIEKYWSHAEQHCPWYTQHPGATLDLLFNMFALCA